MEIFQQQARARRFQSTSESLFRLAMDHNGLSVLVGYYYESQRFFTSSVMGMESLSPMSRKRLRNMKIMAKLQS